MNATSIANLSKTEKIKFRHDSTKLIYFETFIYDQQIHYIAQCETKNVYIGRASQGKFQLSHKVKVKQKIKSIFLMWKTSILWLGTIKGTIYGIDFLSDNMKTGEQQQMINHKIQSIDGKPIIGILSLTKQNKQEEQNAPNIQRIVISFTSEGIIRHFLMQKLIQTVKLPAHIIKFKAARAPSSRADIWCAFIMKNKGFPYIFDIKAILKLIKDGNTIAQQLQVYENALNYEQDQYIHNSQPCSIALSDSTSILILVYTNQICIYQIHKKQHFYAYLDYQFATMKGEQIEEAVDIIGTSLAYKTLSSIYTYDIEKRQRICKSLNIKGTSSYNALFWGKCSEYLLYGSIDTGEKTKMIFHTINNARDNEKE